jgi:glucose-1-phosphate adenylyltransferase
MGADYYDSNIIKNTLPVGIGENCIIRNAIIDKNARIGNNVKITNVNKKNNFDGTLFYIRNGIVVIPKNTIIQDDTVI